MMTFSLVIYLNIPFYSKEEKRNGMVENGRFMVVWGFNILDGYIIASLHLEMSQSNWEINDTRETNNYTCKVLD